MRTALGNDQAPASGRTPQTTTAQCSRFGVRPLPHTTAASRLTRMAGALLFVASLVHADDWQALDAATKEVRVLEAELKVVNAAVAACREGIAQGKAELAPLRQAVADAEQEATQGSAELVAAREKLQKAQAARNDKVESLLANAPDYQAAKNRQAELRKQIGKWEGRLPVLKEGELLELARLRQEEQHLAKQLYGAQKAWWKRGEVAQEFAAAAEAYQAVGALPGKGGDQVQAARKALADATDALPVDNGLTKQAAELETKIAAAKAKAGELEKSLLAGKTVTITVKVFDKKAKAEVDKKLSLWLPATDYIRGVILAHPMISGLASATPIRIAAAREGLGMMVYDNYSGDPKESLQRIDAMLERFAAESKHPELNGAPLILGGLSASVLATRNVACVAPERVLGVVHAAGGNLQEMPDDGRGMVQVPFLAMNGEFEWCGPAGGGHASGKAGIRAEYGNQTQWVMIREQMLRLWRNKQEHRMMLVVVPNADHGAWNHELTALFVRKAAQYRLPKEKRDGTKPAVCAQLPVNKGWLTDADLDHPKHEPAPYDKFDGDKNNAFWHFDEEMARTVYEFHKGKFLLPDPTQEHPVPADWPAKNK